MGALLWLCLAAGLHAQAKKVVNLLENPGFERKMKGWTTQSYHKTGQFSLDDTLLVKGKPTLKIENASPDDSMIVQKVAVKPGTRYQFSAVVKTKDVAQEGGRKGGGAVLAIKGGFEKSEVLSGTEEWRDVNWEFSSGTKTEVEICLRLGFYSTLTSGTAWFTEVWLVELGPDK